MDKTTSVNIFIGNAPDNKLLFLAPGCSIKDIKVSKVGDDLRVEINSPFFIYDSGPFKLHKKFKSLDCNLSNGVLSIKIEFESIPEKVFKVKLG